MYDDCQKRCLIRLVQNLRNNKENSKKKITLFLGAGCSLSSSKKDISTTGIIKDLVNQYSYENEQVPEEWIPLYTQFVNNIWNGQGNVDRINLLKNYFAGMQPSIGYRQIRVLIEHNFINNIITTNFDPMLDEILDGLSYYFQVGTKQQTIGNNPQFTLLKAHGDLKEGQLRFTPSELYKLPEQIESKINMLTDGIVIIVGYRGQDMGIIQALNSTDNHCAYWITYSQPDSYNEYENGPIINWLKKRNSENNLLFGPEYGDFDTVFTKIKDMLQHKNLLQENQFYLLWKKSYINDYMVLNLRLQKIFMEMLKILEDFFVDTPWTACSLYYAESHDKLVGSIISILNEKVFPSEYLYYISNEVDSLLFAISIEIWSLCQGYPFTNIFLTELLQEKYSENNNNPYINQEFWDALKWLSGLAIPEVTIFEKPYCEIIISLDKEKDLQVILKKVSLMEFSNILLTVQRILLFMRTSDAAGNDVIGISHKKTLEQHLYQILAYDKRIDIHLNTMPQALYRKVFKGLLSRYFSEQILGNRHILYSNNLYVQVDVEEISPNIVLSLVDELNQKAKDLQKVFIGDTDITRIVWNSSFDVLEKFLHSESNGLFIIGESGIGKTCMLKKFIVEEDMSKYIILPILGKQIKNNISNYTSEQKISEHNDISHINTMLEMRQQTLILIVDGINEMDAPLHQIIATYQKLLDFCDSLSQKNLLSIRIIITCRQEFYYQIQNNICLQPSPSSFFSKVNKQGEDSTVCFFPYLQEKDITTIIENYSLSYVCDIDLLKKTFGDIIFIPFYLDMVCKMNSGKVSDENCPSEFLIYQTWFNSIINIAQGQNIPILCINEILDYIIAEKYFTDSKETLTTSRLFMNITKQTEYAPKTFEWLVEHAILKKAQLCQNMVMFMHDKIEGFFLVKYIRKRYGGNLDQAATDLNPKHQNTPIIQDSIYMLLNNLQMTDKNAFNNSVISIVNHNNEWLIFILINLLLENAKNLYTVLKEIEQFVCRSVLENYISLIFSRIEQKIDTYDCFDICAMKCLDQYINNSTVGRSHLLRALNYHNYARYIWTFPINGEDATYTMAIKLCKKLNKLDGILPPKLIDNNNQLLAVLLRNDGKLNEAVNLMEQVYQSLYKNACFNDACQALLDLGAMYRELTWFDKALALYQDFDVSLVSDISLRYRLYMNTGIIYKNKVQNNLFSKCVTQENTYDAYYKSRSLFNDVYNYAKKNNHIPLLLEIIAELIESTVAGYYLNITTISEAVAYAEEMDAVLPKYPIPIRRIQSYRMWARILNLQGRTLEAIKELRNGFKIAIHYNIPFRAADCCNQISGILCDNLNNSYINSDILQEGIEACQYSINYYLRLQQSNHVYLNDSRIKLKKLQKVLDEMH